MVANATAEAPSRKAATAVSAAASHAASRRPGSPPSFSANATRVIGLLVQRVNYDGARGKVSITFHPTGIKTLAEELANQQGEKSA